MKSVLKWALRLGIVAVVLVVAFFLSLDSIFRFIIERNIHDQTGMVAKIGKFHLGLTEPVVEIKDLKLYNSPEFGGTSFLNIPEIYVEYDRAALQRHEIHISLLRFDLGELDIVRNQSGQTNILSLGLPLPTKTAAGAPAKTQTSSQQLAALEKQSGLDIKEFKIDCLNVSVGGFKYVDLQDQKNDREQKIGIEHCVITNVTSSADLAGLALLVGLRSGDFFKPLVAPGAGDAAPSAQDLLKLLGH